VSAGDFSTACYSGRLQYVFGSPTLRSIAVVDWEETRLFGLYGHPKPGGFEQAWQNRYLRFGAIVEAQTVRQ